MIQTVSLPTLRRFAIAVVRAGSVLQREATRLFRPFGVSAAHFNVLNLLAAAPNGLRASEITDSLVVDPSSTTYILDQLEVRGWAARRRNPDDRRALTIVLTPSGKNLHAKILPVYHAALQRMIPSFSASAITATLPTLDGLPFIAEQAVTTTLAQPKKPARAKAAKKRRLP